MTQTRKDLYSLWLPAGLCLILLLFQVYFLLRDLNSFDFDSENKPRTGVTLATLQSTQSEVRHRFGGTLLWNTPQAQAALLQNDAIATMADSQAVLVFPDQSELLLEADTLIILEEAPNKNSEGRIVARLVRGSVVRKKSGKAPLMIRVSGKTDAPLQRFDDQTGNAIFRLVVRAHGIEVTVETGSVLVNQKQTVSPGKLRAPQLKKPQINILPKQSLLQHVLDFAFPSAHAAEPQPSHPVQIQFEWEKIEEAAAYDLQISDSPEFKTILLEKRVMETGYSYTTSAEKTQELYFRVAAIRSNGETGEFSAIEKITIQKLEQKPSPPPPVAPPVPHQASAPPSPRVLEPKPLKSLPTSTASLIPRKKWSGFFALMASFHHRNFDNPPAVSDFSGNGILPLGAHAEISFFERISLGGIYLPETAQPQSAGSHTQTLSIPWARSWITTPFPFWEKIHLGASLSLSQTFEWSPVQLHALTALLPGIALEVRPLPGFRIQGSWLPHRLQGGWEGWASFFHPLKLRFAPGVFVLATGTARWIQIEKSYSASLGVGYAL